MSTVNFIAATQPSTAATSGRYINQQTVLAAQSRPEANATSATISPAAMGRASFEQGMAERFAGRNQQRAMLANDPSNSLYAEWLDGMAQQNFSTGTGEGALLDISGTVSGGDGILRYSSGEPVAAESQAYQQRQVNSYKNAAMQLYNSEMGKGSPPGDIIIKVMDLQEQQPARFRAMMMWPAAADFASTS